MKKDQPVQVQGARQYRGKTGLWALGLATGAWVAACSAQGPETETTGKAAPTAEQKAAAAPRAALTGQAQLRYELTRSAEALHFDVSPPFRTLPPAQRQSTQRLIQRLAPSRSILSGGEPSAGAEFQPESGLLPKVAITPNSVTSMRNFEGIGDGFTGPGGTFSVNVAPPDPFGVVGPSHYVQIVNSDIAIFNKSGTVLYGPVATNTLWAGFGGACQTQNAGDGTVNYDRAANRWVISQFTAAPPYLQCVAVSTTGDPTGSYARYAFDQPHFADYPKIGVWPDAYYASFNLFVNTSGGYISPEVCAYDRAKMLAGSASTQQCFTPSSTYFGLLPADLEGATPPPAGAPNPFVALDPVGSQLDVFEFHADFTNPSNSTFSGPTVLPVNAYTQACGGGVCIPQRGESAQLDSLGDRLMYRASYRNFGDHQSLVVNHSVVAGSSTGVRWYEIRDPSGAPVVFQQGTFAPDGDFRWMGSAAINQQGSIALGYSVSSSSLFPSIRATGRLASDPLGQTPQGELTIMAGAGSQSDSGSRWGDYSGMTVDPTDDCTFWYTNQYEATSGSFNWHTRIGSFTIGTCTTPPINQAPAVNAGPDQTITLPATATLAGTATDDGLPNPPGRLTITWSKVSGPGTVTFSNASSVNTTATFSVDGTYVLQLSASDGSLTTNDTITIVVNPAATNPCAGICSNPVNFSINGSFQSGNLGTGPVCLQTTAVVHGGNCGNFVAPRSLTVNGQSRPCTGQNWSSVPPARNGGYCIAATAGQFPWAFVTAW